MRTDTMKALSAQLYHRLVRETLVPLALMIVTPNVAILMPYIVVYKKSDLIQTFTQANILQVLRQAWRTVDWLDTECWLIVCGTFLWGIFTLLLPGKMYHGPLTVTNFRPTYWKNGFRFYLLSMCMIVPLIWNFSVLHLYYKLTTLIGILNIFGLAFCVMLYIKGILLPDPGIFDMSGNPIFDFYWGIELYPHFGRYISLKLLINSRFGLWLWQLVVLVMWKAHYELYMAKFNRGEWFTPMTASALLQTVYLAKFYYWEDGYMQTIDTSVDRFGFMIAWGCIAWVPSFYTLASIYLVKNSPTLQYESIFSLVVILIGLPMIFANYCVDYQRQLVRNTDGNCNIWGKKPHLIRAKYLDDKGNERNSILLASGFWGIGRHLNYLFELIAAFCFGLPALWYSIIPYLYFLFLTVLLVHRAHRDDKKCSKKYTRYWEEYRKVVPYKIVPYIY